MNRLLPLGLSMACATLSAQETPSVLPYVNADFGFARFLEAEIDDDAPSALEDMQDDMKSAKRISFATGLRGANSGLGLGLFYQSEWSEAKTTSPIFLGMVQIDRTTIDLKSNLFGVQGIAVVPLTEKLFLRGEFGLGKATATQTMELDMHFNDAGTRIDAQSTATTKYSGLGSVMAVGFDVMFNRNFGLGGKLGLTRGTLSADSYKIEAVAGDDSDRRTMDTDDVDDANVSSIGFTLGIRLSM